MLSEDYGLRVIERKIQSMKAITSFKIPMLLTAMAGLSACAVYDGYGYDTGYYGDGYASGAYPDECYDRNGYLYPDCEDAGYIARNGYGYGSIFYSNRYGPYGWYDGYYYPGYSDYIYDRAGRRHNWNERHRRHWEGRRHARGDRDRHRGDGWRDGDRRRGDGWRGDRDQRPPERRARDQRRDGDRNTRRGSNQRGPYLGVPSDTTPRAARDDGANRRANRRDGATSRRDRPAATRTNQRRGRDAGNVAPRQANPAPAPRRANPPPAQTRQDRPNRRVGSRMDAEQLRNTHPE